MYLPSYVHKNILCSGNVAGPNMLVDGCDPSITVRVLSNPSAALDIYYLPSSQNPRLYLKSGIFVDNVCANSLERAFEIDYETILVFHISIFISMKLLTDRHRRRLSNIPMI